VLAAPEATVLVWHRYRPLVRQPAFGSGPTEVVRLPLSCLSALGVVAAADTAGAAAADAATTIPPDTVVLGTAPAPSSNGRAPVVAVELSRLHADAGAVLALLAARGLLPGHAASAPSPPPPTSAAPAPAPYYGFVELRELLMTGRLLELAGGSGGDATSGTTANPLPSPLFDAPPAGLPWRLPYADVALVGLARSLLVWAAKTRHCGACGSSLRPVEGGTKRVCTGDRPPPPSPSPSPSSPPTSAARPGCGESVYPRTDPVAISLVLSPDDGGSHALLGRGTGFPPGFYSCLAGFVEGGESVEVAAAREVAEETGVACDAVRYAGSQPWPVGRGATMYGQLMLGCVARAAPVAAPPPAATATGGDGNLPLPPIRIDPAELADARWFSRAEVAAALRWHYEPPAAAADSESSGGGSGARGGGVNGGAAPLLKVPGPYAIAHNLMRAWVRGELGLPPAAALR
jgi:NADH pyrophosphatase NudC (nudix superfamily)